MQTSQTQNGQQTLEERFCAKHGCSAEEFPSKVFWMCLHRHAVILAPPLLLFKRDYFAADHELVAGIRRAVKMSEVWEEVRAYFLHPKHQGWLRKRANVRISVRRVINLSRDFLPSSGPPPPAYEKYPQIPD